MFAPFDRVVSIKGPGIVTGPLVALALAVLLPVSADAQLRPVEPMNWPLFDDSTGRAFIGVAGFHGQPASLVGSEGRLVELGVLGASIRSGRIVISFQGSAYRVFDASESFADPLPTIEDPSFKRRGDSGDYIVTTAMRLTSGVGPWDAAFRFGVRLPTTDDRVGLERDQTDFFTTVAGRYRKGRLAFELEAGAAINGVVGPKFDQTDPVLYGIGVVVLSKTVESSIRVGGQHDTRANGPPRGNEHLSELRLGIRSLGSIWFQAEGIAGLARFSPDLGLRLNIGRTF